jgi:hypothetical protein
MCRYSGEVSWSGNDLKHEILGVKYTVCRLKEFSHHIACSNVQVVLRILSSSKKHLSSYKTRVNNNVTDICKSAGSRNVVNQGYGTHASNPKQYIYSQFNSAWHVSFSDVLFSPSITLKSQNPRTDVIVLPPTSHIIQYIPHVRRIACISKTADHGLVTYRHGSAA